jgi:hypothetical protein
MKVRERALLLVLYKKAPHTETALGLASVHRRRDRMSAVAVDALSTAPRVDPRRQHTEMVSSVLTVVRVVEVVAPPS